MESAFGLHVFLWLPQIFIFGLVCPLDRKTKISSSIAHHSSFHNITHDQHRRHHHYRQSLSSFIIITITTVFFLNQARLFGLRSSLSMSDDDVSHEAIAAALLPHVKTSGFLQYEENLKKNQVCPDKLLQQADLLGALVKALKGERLSQSKAVKCVKEIYRLKGFSISCTKVKEEAGQALARRMRTALCHYQRVNRGGGHLGRAEIQLYRRNCSPTITRRGYPAEYFFEKQFVL